MAVNQAGSRLAFDSNVLLDLAASRDFAHTLLEVGIERGVQILVSPTSIQELHLLTENADQEKARLALVALQSIRVWNIRPVDLSSVQRAIAIRIAEALVINGFLPSSEEN